MKKILFIDRDGVILKEPPGDFQVDSLEKTDFVPGAISTLARIAAEFDFYKVMVTNQDDLGTATFPEEKFRPSQDIMLKALASEGFYFDEIIIDRSFPQENKPTRKPGTALLAHFFDNKEYDLAGSFVIGDRVTDMQLAKNLGASGIFIQALHPLEITEGDGLEQTLQCRAAGWKEVYAFLKNGLRTTTHQRVTKETTIDISLHADGSGKTDIRTGLGFFDHMLEQIATHGLMDLSIRVAGDLQVDEHHTIEDTAIALGEAFSQVLADKRGLQRYGFHLPMDDAAASVLIDFGGRNWLVWEAAFRREKIGEMPTEMFMHFFKSFSDAAKCNLHIKAEGQNEHHKIEAIFKAFARAVRMAIRRDPFHQNLPSTKGVL